MAQNTDPVYPKAPKIGAVAVTAANTRSDGVGTIGTDIFLVGTVGADGALLRSIDVWPLASVAATSTTATVARLFLSTQSSGATSATDTYPIGELPLASQTAASTTVAVAPQILPLNRYVPASMSILATTHAAPAANTSQRVVAYWGELAA